jgi:hypothetical protein
LLLATVSKEQDVARTPPPAYSHIIGTRVPKPFSDAVHVVANNRLTTVSTFLRQILADVLRAEGFDVAKLRDEPPGNAK